MWDIDADELLEEIRVLKIHNTELRLELENKIEAYGDLLKTVGSAKVKFNEEGRILCMSSVCRSENDCPNYAKCEDYYFNLTKITEEDREFGREMRKSINTALGYEKFK